MKPWAIALLAGWLLSSFLQVPAPVQSGLRNAAGWVKGVVVEKWNGYKRSHRA